ncbi:MAG: MurR/RpiR family transcriptional regulator [Actinomycetota bacterium]|nr:MurR/RpiR family transcriptional regulator [Actinomycetota bacterium]
MGVVERITLQAPRLTTAERKVAEVLAAEPQAIAFGTVAQVARRAATSGPSVIRLAVKLGYDGFVDMQADVQSELARQLGPARDRIRQRPPTHLVHRVLAAELDNVARTLRAVDTAVLERAVGHLSDRRRQVWVLPGEVTLPIGLTLSGQLGQLRDGVTLLAGSEVAIGRALGGLEGQDILIAIDVRRYERSLVRLSRWSVTQGARLIALTDNPLSPLAGPAHEAFFLSAQGVGPFDSMAGGLALANALVAGVAARLRPSATARLDGTEAAWAAADALVAEPGGSAPLT